MKYFCEKCNKEISESEHLEAEPLMEALHANMILGEELSGSKCPVPVYKELCLASVTSLLVGLMLALSEILVQRQGDMVIIIESKTEH